MIKPGDETFRKLLEFSGPSDKYVNISGIKFIEKQEALSLTLHDHDGGENTTIGFGHYVHRGKINHSHSEDQFRPQISEQEAEGLLETDLQTAKDAVKRLVGVPLTQNQFDALVSFCFNVKKREVENSTLLKMLNGSTSPREFTGDYLGAADQFKFFVRSGTHHPAGLPGRRRAERDLFLRR
ncbi:MAG: lysozyme [Candidatus Binataceae bacterium]